VDEQDGAAARIAGLDYVQLHAARAGDSKSVHGILPGRVDQLAPVPAAGATGPSHNRGRSRHRVEAGMRVAIGLKARTGRAILVAVGGRFPDCRVAERSELPLLPAGAFAPYHAAAELDSPAAHDSVQRSITAARVLATQGIRAAVDRLAGAGHEVAACGVLVGNTLPPWTTDEILAVHVRMHAAEGALFRDVLVTGAQACGLALATLPDRSALDAAAAAIGRDRRALDACIAALGRSSGAPWGRDQKEAAAAAMAALAAP
jgi:hypothetical protein